MLDKVVNSGPILAMEKALEFTQARHRVLVENIANADTPGYRTRQLDVPAFQESLRKALENKKQRPSEPFRIEASPEFRQDSNGQLVVTPSVQPAENILFHDGTNGSIERQMAMLAENAMMYNTLTELLHMRFANLLKAVRGQIT